MDKPIRILIADDHSLFREGLVALLNSMPEITHIREAGNGREALDLLRKDRFNLVLMDLHMPGFDGFKTSRIIRKEFPGVKMIALTMSDEHDAILEMSRNGVSGYVLKMAGFPELREAITRVHAGEKYFSEPITKILVDGIIENNNNENFYHRDNIITPIEKEILWHLCNGLTAQEIGTRMGLARRTIEGHKATLYVKTGTDNMQSLIVYAIKNKLVRL